jgi:DNA-binding CsgD family transcriptional regulator
MMKLNQSLAESQQALDHLSFSVWQMDAGRRITWLNQGAEEIFSAGAYGLHLRDNRFKSQSPGIASSLRAMISNLLEKRSYTETLRINPNGACLVMTLCCASGAGVRIGRAATPGILCFVLDPDLPAWLNHAQLQAIYQLTPAELRLANLLVSGLDVAEASALLQISKHTGRTQLKSIMQKTGVHRQAELQRKLLICAGILRIPNE